MRIICYPILVYIVDRTETFENWLYGIKDRRAIAAIEARIDRVESGNFGDWKSVGGDVREMRIDYGGGYRLYYTIRGNTVVFFLCGGGKNSQQADIAKAQKLSAEV